MSNLSKLVRCITSGVTSRTVSKQPVAASLGVSVTKRFATTVTTGYQAQQDKNDILKERERPQSMSYFTGNYRYNDLIIELSSLYKRFEKWEPVKTTPEVTADNVDASQEQTQQVYSWKLREKMSETLDIPLTTSQWRKITNHLSALASLPKPLPPAVVKILEPYRRHQVDLASKNKNSQKLDDWGRAYGLGRRKESSASCYLVEGDGKILVNGMELENYFRNINDRNEVTMPLDITELKDKYNAWVLVKGGGTTGQAQAIKLGISKALLVHQSHLKPVLRKAGCVTRDPRVVERKKEGQRKARAKYTWVKR
ncbi:ribosomal protein S5 domain 2-type protein [Mycotypha africana]|uniref:ribosomal protein S5 domain 2-type protein n=1 Tax=Mycotypha africana TaxID=64632 RepID=UPI002300FF2C|nr:ribosomal protein S5 domain 2-type protein [Mycotypha africana]KAI8977090.1 ribosomal protein S5 domain 2-type protein [Mycotypha africana]